MGGGGGGGEHEKHGAENTLQAQAFAWQQYANIMA